MRPIRIVIVDDNPYYRAALMVLLSQEGVLQVVGQAASGDLASGLIGQLQPDLALVDIVLPGMNGFELTHHLKQTAPALRVIALTMHALPSYKLAAITAGADDFIIKDQVPEQLLPAIRRLFPPD